jgi:hypothetical protein
MKFSKEEEELFETLLLEKISDFTPPGVDNNKILYENGSPTLEKFTVKVHINRALHRWK